MSEFGVSPNDQNGDKKSYRDQLMDAMEAAEKWNTEKADSDTNESIRKQKLEGFRRFLRFEVLPDREPDYFVVAGTSPIIDKNGFDSRARKSVELSKEFPNTKFIFSGHMPINERVTGEETETEAEMMSNAAVSLGMKSEKAETETTSRHLKENIEFSLRKILNEIGMFDYQIDIAIVASMSMMRRCYYYANKILSSEEFSDIIDKIKLYYISSDDNLDDEAAVYYEMGRLLKYRENNWL